MATTTFTRWTRVLFVLALIGALPASELAAAVDPVHRKASTYLASLGERAIQVAQDETVTRQDQEQRMRALLREGFDLKVLARFVLGRHWRTLDDAQRREFADVFEDAMVQQTLTVFGRYTGESFDITGAEADRTNPKLISIKVNIKKSDGSLLARLNYRMRKVGQDFKVVDIVAEGVSMALTLRQEYAAVIARSEGKVDGLIAKLRRSAAWEDDTGNEAGEPTTASP